MNDIKQTHREAMALLDEADAAMRRGDSERARSMRQAAFSTELHAALMTVTHPELEPTRSVLHRSAASIALTLGDETQATRLLHLALAGDPPIAMRIELQSMLEDLSFRRHLQVRGLELSNDEIQLSISGEGIGYGIAPVEEVTARIEGARLLLTRTAERILRRPYRTAGPQSRAVQELITPMLSVPRAASFAVGLRVGRVQQTAFPGLGRTEQIVDELIECLRLFADQDERGLRKQIPEPDYYRNFLALSTAMSPDGRVVNLVGFTTSRTDGPREVAIRNNRSIGEQMLLDAPRVESAGPKRRSSKPIEVSGLLRYADALKDAPSTIKLRSDDGKTFNVIVPSGIDDIVRPLWGELVTITGDKNGRNIELRSIRPSNRPSEG